MLVHVEHSGFLVLHVPLFPLSDLVFTVYPVHTRTYHLRG